MEGSNCDIIEVLVQYLPAGAEENGENPESG
jgi:hypothetical protein